MHFGTFGDVQRWAKQKAALVTGTNASDWKTNKPRELKARYRIEGRHKKRRDLSAQSTRLASGSGREMEACLTFAFLTDTSVKDWKLEVTFLGPA